MPYITNEQMTAKRNAIKKAFPNWRFSITRLHYSTISVDILEAPIDLINKEGNRHVNPFYIKDQFEGEVKESLQKIYEIASEGKRELVYDQDYGSVPTFYTDINIGKWDKPFIYKQ